MMAELFALFRPPGHKPHKPLLGIEIWVKGLDSKIN